MSRKFPLVYQQIVSSIAFLPAIISLLFFLLAGIMVYFDFPFAESTVVKSMQILMVKGNDNARQVLGALIGGIISLTVFSFSMVMLLLNQASSSFTPRIIPGLLTDKKHQFVLGFYLGTIIYCIIIILNITPGEASHNSPKFGVLLAMVFGIICLSLFIYFIHLISQKIQVDTIIFLLTNKTIRLIEKNSQEISGAMAAYDTSSWYTLSSGQSGYFSDIHLSKLEKIGRDNQIYIKMLQPPGSFLLEHTPLCSLSENTGHRKDLQSEILSCFVFSYEPYGENLYLHGVNQLSEIAVKALSPGINDPGTAIIALDHLSKVFCALYQQKPRPSVKASFVIHATYTLEELLFHFISPIGNYGKSDAKVCAALLEFYKRLLPVLPLPDKETVFQQLKESLETIENYIQSPSQVALLKNQIKAFLLNTRSV